MDPNFTQPAAPQAVTAQPQAMPTPYPVQGTAAMQPQYQMPSQMQQAYSQPQVAYLPTQSTLAYHNPVMSTPQAPQGSYQPASVQSIPSPYNNNIQAASPTPTQVLADTVRDQQGFIQNLVNILSSPVQSLFRGESSQNQQSQPQHPPAGYQQPQYSQVPVSPQTWQTSPTSGQPSSPQSQPLPPHLQELVLKSASASASLGIPASEIPYNPSQLNAVAVALEDAVVAQAPYVADAHKLVDLLINPQRFGELTAVYFDQMGRVPGGFDLATEMYLRYGQSTGMFQQANQYLSQQQFQGQGQPQGQLTGTGINPQMAAMMQPQMQPPAQTIYQWDNGQTVRPQHPEIPNPAGYQSQAGLDAVTPQNAWQAVDQLDSSGYFRGKQLVIP